jgi:topoisomerase-4 subunit A
MEKTLYGEKSKRDNYNKLLRETKNLPDNLVNIADLIEVKGMKAQGNQMTKLKVKEIVLTHEIDGGEPWPNEEGDMPVIDLDGIVDLDSDSDSDGDSPTIEWDILPKKDDEDESQIKLFD